DQNEPADEEILVAAERDRRPPGVPSCRPCPGVEDGAEHSDDGQLLWHATLFYFLILRNQCGPLTLGTSTERSIISSVGNISKYISCHCLCFVLRLAECSGTPQAFFGFFDRGSGWGKEPGTNWG